MCGIAGALDLGAGPGVLDTVDPMSACLFHRGPDEDGLYRDETVALGSRRLSIVDIAGSTQPIANEDETVWIVFNGQIYNYVELRKDLERRHTFRTQGDTETLVHLYEEEGPDFVKKLRGMFVFAIWDTKRRSLLLGRDRFGKKPLYYTRAAGDRFLFASEIKALLQHGQVETTLDTTAIYQYLCFGFVPHPRTAYNEIAAVPPAHWLQIDADGRQTLQRYWHLPPGGTFKGSRQDALDQIKTRLRRVGADQAQERRAGRRVPLRRDRQRPGDRLGGDGLGRAAPELLDRLRATSSSTSARWRSWSPSSTAPATPRCWWTSMPRSAARRIC